MSQSTGLRNLGDAPICVAIDKSGSTWGETLREEIKAVQNICSLLSPRNEKPISLLPWCDWALDPIYLPKQSTSMLNLTSDGGTDPSVLYSSPACLRALTTCELWFLLTDGKIDNRLVQKFALATAELGLHSLACVVIVFGSTMAGPPAKCDISVGIAAYAVAPDCLFLFHDIPTGKLSIMQAKGRFKELLSKSGTSFVQPILNKYTTWAELPHMTYEDLSRIRIAPPKKVAADELALQNDLVVRMQDLYTGAADPESVGEILKNEDNLKSIVIAEMTRGTGKELQAWLDTQQKPLPELTRDRPDVGGRAQRAVSQLLDSLNNGDTAEKIEKLQDDLRKAHEENWRQFQIVIQAHTDNERTVVFANDSWSRARYHTEKLVSHTGNQTWLSQNSWPHYDMDKVDVTIASPNGGPQVRPLFLPGFKRCPDAPNSEFVQRCMLCCREAVLVILLKTPPDITTTNFPREGSYTPLAFPLAMSTFAETDILSFFICCDSCALYLVRNYTSPLSETVTGALPLASVEDNKAAWFEALDCAFKGRFQNSDLPTLFIAILDRMILENKTRSATPANVSLYHDALQWAKCNLSKVAEVPDTLSSSFMRGNLGTIRTRSLYTVLSDRALFDPGDFGNVEISMLRYPVPGFIVIARLMRDQGTTREQLQTHMFQRLMYHITEVYFTMLQKEGERHTTASLDKMLNCNTPQSTPTPQGLAKPEPATAIPIDVLLLHNFLDSEALASFRTMEEFAEVETRTRPATAVYLHALAGSGASYSSPVEYFNGLKASQSMNKIVLRPLAISEGLSADLIFQMQTTGM
jgi:hypothetical protein